MIHFFTTRSHAYTLELYLQIWGRDLRDRIAPPRYYEELPFRPRLNPGVYIFTDLERLGPAETELAVEVHRQLSARPGAFRLLNDPAKTLRRCDLLRTLHAEGLNRFNARKIDDGSTTLDFPVFLRNDSDHKGAISPLLTDASEVDRAVAEAIAQGQDRNHLLLVQYIDTRDATGLYHKYSYFRVGPHFIPRHLIHTGGWVVKNVDRVDPPCIEEEMAFLQSNPHVTQLQRIFDIAHVDYGRIDYALIDNQIQTFEINTNPTITVPPGRIAISRLQISGIFAAQFADAMKSLDQAPPGGSSHRIEIPRELARKMQIPPTQRALRPIARAIRWLAHHPSIDRIGQ